ncbi:hypothetical protein K474DRAFT_1659025 [Panus rudis PR-1116 ss-1]|nr:hypothetical protein K474DRAFT_1659025 [Panus rudis PR-1116 ss-1]
MPPIPNPKRTILPSQIKHTILTHLYDIGDHTTLRACTLTSRDWLNAARRFTLRRLVFSRSSSRHVGARGGGGGREKIERVLRDGGLRDVVFPYVLELVVDLTRTDVDLAADSDEGDILGATTIPEWVYALLEVFLPRLHFLRTLSFRGLHLDSNSNAAFHIDGPERNDNDDRNQNPNSNSNPKQNQNQEQDLDRITRALSRVSRSTPIRALELSECALDTNALGSLLGSMPSLTSLRILSPLLLPAPKQKREKGTNSTLDGKSALVPAEESGPGTKMDASRTPVMQLKELVYYDDTRDVSGQITLLTDLLSLSIPLLSFNTLQSLDVTLNSPSALLAVNTLLKTCNETLRELKLRYPKGTKCWGRDRGYAGSLCFFFSRLLSMRSVLVCDSSSAGVSVLLWLSRVSCVRLVSSAHRFNALVCSFPVATLSGRSSPNSH